MGNWRDDITPNMNILLQDLSPNITETIAMRMSTPHFEKDWKFLSCKLGYNIREMEAFALENQTNPCLAMLRQWQNRENSTVRFLDDILRDMGRYDVSMELCNLMKKDTQLIVYIEGANNERKISVEVSGQATLENALSEALREENLQVRDLSIVSPTQVVPVNWNTPAHYFQGVEIQLRLNENYADTQVPPASSGRNHPIEHDEGNTNGIDPPSGWLPIEELCSENHLIPWYPELSDKTGPIAMFFGRYIQEDGWYLFKYYQMKKLGLCVTHNNRVLMFLVHSSSMTQFYIDSGDFKASTLEELVQHYHNCSFPKRALEHKNIEQLTLKSPLNRDIRRTCDDQVTNMNYL